jgi:hypothetical protein
VKLNQPRRQVNVFYCVRVKNVTCPLHLKPLMLAAWHQFCKSCLIAKPAVRT